MSTLDTFGTDMQKRIKDCLLSSGVVDKSNAWATHPGPPGDLSGRCAWAQIASVDFNSTYGKHASIEALVYFAAPASGKHNEISLLFPKLFDPSGFAAHWQRPPYPDGYSGITSQQMVVTAPEEGGTNEPFAMVRFLFTALVA